MPKIIEIVCTFIATTGYSGFLLGKITGKRGYGAGTVGSVIGLLLVYLATFTSDPRGWVLLIAYSSLFLGLISIGVAEEAIVLKHGSLIKHTGKPATYDLNSTNIDEVHGQAIASYPVVIYYANSTINEFDLICWLLVSLVIFRVIDSTKIPPVKQVEDYFKGSHGIMLDDTVAGMMSLVLITLAIYLYY